MPLCLRDGEVFVVEDWPWFPCVWRIGPELELGVALLAKTIVVDQMFQLFTSRSYLGIAHPCSGSCGPDRR